MSSVRCIPDNDHPERTVQTRASGEVGVVETDESVGNISAVAELQCVLSQIGELHLCGGSESQSLL